MDEAAFDNAMMRNYNRARDELGINARGYLAMLNEYRGLETARRLINAAKPSDGYTDLWECGRLDLSVEALVLQPEWASLFAQEPELLQKARKRLAEFNYQG